MRRLLVVLGVTAAVGCTGPVRSYPVYASKAAATAGAEGSAVETARLAVGQAAAGKLFGRTLAQTLAEAASDAGDVQATFDESTRADVRSCCGGLGRGGRIPTIVAGPRVPPGRDPVPSTHYSLLRSIEAAYGLPFLGHAGDPATATIPAIADPSPQAA